MSFTRRAIRSETDSVCPCRRASPLRRNVDNLYFAFLF